MSKFTVIPHTAYPLFADKKPEVYNCSPIDIGGVTSAKAAAKAAVEQQRREWEGYGDPGSTGTFRYAVIGHELGYQGSPTVEIVDITVKSATVRVTDVETA